MPRALLLLVLMAVLAMIDVSQVHAAAGTPPVAVADDLYNQPVGQPITVHVLANDVDADGDIDASTVRILNPANLGQQVVEAAVEGEGIWQVNVGAGTILYTPCSGNGVPGSYCHGPFLGDPFPIEYQVADQTGLQSNPAIITITAGDGLNLPPLAVDDNAKTSLGQAMTIDVLANDVDPDGALDPGSVVVTGQASHGVATAEISGAIHYVPNAGFAGQDQFDYQVCDMASADSCGSATVFVTVELLPNQLPLVRDDQAVIPQNQPFDILVLSNDQDPDGSLDVASLQVVTAPAHGSATKNVDGSVTYTSTLDFVGADSFLYQVCDDWTPAACGTATVHITVTAETTTNQAFAFDDGALVRAGESVSGNVLANDVDPEGDGWLAPSVTTEPNHGTVVLQADGAFTYAAQIDFDGDDSWRYTVCDQGLPQACASATVIVTVLPASSDSSTVHIYLPVILAR